MIRNQIYYHLKPFIPRSVQLFFRRQIALQKKKKYSHIWPIDHSAATLPEGWKGWPDNKKFAIVLSHDVDTQKGYENIQKLVDIEIKMGFKSCINLVPEKYHISSKYVEDIKKKGFEIGVHGLKHDGKLFLSKKIFFDRAKKINKYFDEWETTFFTSPSMHHNFNWMHKLKITHGITTFDTDPFEPQPDAVRTIFPFYVKNNHNKNGYVELPYTLPQDFTLFVILNQKDVGAVMTFILLR